MSNCSKYLKKIKTKHQLFNCEEYEVNHGYNLGTPHYRTMDRFKVGSNPFFYDLIWIKN